MMGMYFSALILILTLALALVDGSQLKPSQNSHMVVLAHGIMGSPKDLTYLSDKLRDLGCVVLISKENKLLNSLMGIEKGAKNLVQEIERELDRHNGEIDRISFVGNSLGGLYARASVALYSKSKPSNLKYYKFLTIATPHLSVNFHNYLEESFHISLPVFLKTWVSKTMGQTGRELFMRDDQLLFRMSTEEEYLNPLRLFTSRRLYANLLNDFVVPLGTAAILDSKQVDLLRRMHGNTSGIVEKLETTGTRTRTVTGESSSSSSLLPSLDDALDNDSEKGKLKYMLAGLNSLQWEKFICHFPGSLPIAHNKIAALRKTPEFLFVHMLGTVQGEIIMDHAAEWLTSD
jgi:hypothetical protein